MKLIKDALMLIANYIYDYVAFIKYSGVFFKNSEKKYLGKIIFNYHSLEKGLINEQIRYRYGKIKVEKLLKYIHIWVNNNYNLADSQFLTACSVLKKYFDIHKNNNVAINDYFSNENLLFIEQYAKNEIGGVYKFKSSNYFENSYNSFDKFSISRHSIRNFNKDIIPISIINEVIEIAKNAPSVCNRQSVKVFLIQDYLKVQKILKVQKGIEATAETINQLLILTSDMNAFVSPVERNQMFVDGGVFLQNLLYSLHFKQVAACALNWSKPFYFENDIRKFIDIGHNLRIIAVVAFGNPTENFKVPFSFRKNNDEILEIVN